MCGEEEEEISRETKGKENKGSRRRKRDWKQWVGAEMVQVGRSVQLVYDINTLMAYRRHHNYHHHLISIIRLFIVMRVWRHFQVDKS